MKNKKKLKRSSLCGIVIILIVVIIIVVLLVFNGKSLDTDSDEVTTMYSYLGSNDLDACGGLVVYDDEVVTSDSLDNATKICIAYTLVSEDDITSIKVDESKKGNTCSISDSIVFATDNYEDDICSLTKVDASLIEENYKKVYGEEIQVYDEFSYDSTTICYYNADDDSYYCGLAQEYTYTIGAEPHTYRSIKKAVKNDDEIIIYDYFLKIVNDECYTSFMGSTVNDECSNKYSSTDDITYKFLKKYGTLYKHTFKLGDDGYYWVSSEIS